jgi:hypothetical protein
MAFSITDAAFEGFRVMRRAPMAVVMWGVTYFVCLALILFAAGATLMSIAQNLGSIEQNPMAAGAMMGSIFTVYLVAIPLSLIAASIIVAATCRAVLTPKQAGFFYLRLGGAELRLMGAYLVVALAFIVCMFLVMLAFVAIIGGSALMSGGMSDPTSGPPPVALALIYPLYFGMIILYVWASVRLSLLGPITVAEGRFALGRAWSATKGRFWTLLDLGAATIVRWFLVYFAAIVLFCVLAVIGAGGLIGANLETATPGEAMGLILPFVIIGAIVLAGFAALQFTVLSTPFAVFYRDVIAAKAVEPEPSDS